MSVALTGLNCLLYFTCWKMHFYIYYSANNGILPKVLLMTDEPTPLQYTYCIIFVHKSDFHYVLLYKVNGSYIRVVRRYGLHLEPELLWEALWYRWQLQSQNI